MEPQRRQKNIPKLQNLLCHRAKEGSPVELQYLYKLAENPSLR